MASTSELPKPSPAIPSEFKFSYDIFLSFRGADTRRIFTDHLYHALKQAGFRTFRDDDEIERGENIKSVLQSAIWRSKMSVIVFSEDYASSRACLFEVTTILEHCKKSNHSILPVFYHVDPAKLKEQAGDLEASGNQIHGGKLESMEKVKAWSSALKEVASMAGMVVDG